MESLTEKIPERGITTHSRGVVNHEDPLYIMGKAFTPNRSALNKHFPIIVGRSRFALYQLLGAVFSNPLRNAKFFKESTLSHNATITKNLALLLDMGYIQVESKPRLIIPFGAYVMTNVYRITGKGVKVLSAITGY